MIKLSLAEKVRRANARGWNNAKIAKAYKTTPRYVRRILWQQENLEHRREWEAKRKREQYQTNPMYRTEYLKQQRARRARSKQIPDRTVSAQ